MPFIGQDWRAPGETWIKTTEGWEQMKLRPLRTCSDLSLEGKFDRVQTDSESSNDNSQNLPPIFDNNCLGSVVEFGLDNCVEDAFDWLPHCFVKTSKSKEFVGCASMTEAFLKLDLARAVTDVKRFNYVCKVAQIFVCQKLKHLSGSGRKILLSLIEAIVMHCLTNFKELNSIRMLVNECVIGLNGYQHYCGSKSLLSTHKDAVTNLFSMLTNVPYKSPAECDEDSVTFLDLPIECLRSILKQLPDHESLLTAAETDAALKTLVHAETNLWRDLVKFHFDQAQIRRSVDRIHAREHNFRRRIGQLIAEQKTGMIDKKRCTDSLLRKIESAENLRGRCCDESRLREKESGSKTSAVPLTVRCPSMPGPIMACCSDSTDDEFDEPIQVSWRHLYFELKKFYGLKEMYADMIHICCHCKALFWKGLGHPCVGDNAPSVRVTPQQFIEMLLYS